MKISVIIPNWNGLTYLGTCIEALKRQTYADFEVIVVDNGSTDASVPFLKTKYSSFVQLIELPKNTGFDYATNIGIAQAQGKFIATLNNDTEADPRWLEELIKGMDFQEQVGMCASKILFFNQRHIIDKVGHVFYPDGQNRGRGCMEKDRGQYNKIEEVFFPDACAALYRMEMLKEVGLFDEDFFAYGDDAELGFRARLFGWKCIYIPTAIVYHIHSGTTNPYAPEKVFLVERNRLWLALKLLPWPLLVLNPYYTAIRYFWHIYSALFGVGSVGRFVEQYSTPGIIKTLFKAYISAARGLGNILHKRREIQKKKKVPNREVYQWIKKYRIKAKELALRD
jgi:GT2 family glycosyltransferase